MIARFTGMLCSENKFLKDLFFFCKQIMLNRALIISLFFLEGSSLLLGDFQEKHAAAAGPEVGQQAPASRKLKLGVKKVEANKGSVLRSLQLQLII
jgi:hypothetical protein